MINLFTDSEVFPFFFFRFFVLTGKIRMIKEFGSSDEDNSNT